MNMKHYIGIICAVTVIVGAMAGASVSAADDAEISEITRIVSMETVMEHMEAKGFELTVDGDTLTAYRESPGRTITMTIECPDGECTKPVSPEGNLHRNGFGMKKFHFRMGVGPNDPEAFQAKLESMGMTQEDIDAMKAKFAEMGRRCPLTETAE